MNREYKKVVARAIKGVLDIDEKGKLPSGMEETPDRVVKAYQELLSGYKTDLGSLVKLFPADGYDQIVLLKDIEMYSLCLAGSTFIETPRGRIPISCLNNDEWVYCWDQDQNKMALAQAKNPRMTGRDKQLWGVYADKDSVLCTGEHKFLVYEKGWVQAKDLVPGDSVVALNKGAIRHSDGFVMPELCGGITRSNAAHHRNSQQNDNSSENLQCLPIGEHARLHRKMEEKTGFALFTDEQRRSMEDARLRGVLASQTPEIRAKRSDSLKRYWGSLSKEQREARNYKILMVEKTDWFWDVWCMDVPPYNNFIANGMVVHNCEHHILPFFGKVHVAYIPDKHVIGISKLARIADAFAHRFQIQERLGRQIVDFIQESLQPKGAACIISAEHLCIRMRGVGKQNSIMTTSALSGVFMRNDAFGTSARNELMSLIRMG